MPFGIRNISPKTGGNVGQTTITITGTKMSPATKVSLVAANGTLYPALSVIFQDTDTVFATFDLTFMATGSYDVRIDDPAQLLQPWTPGLSP